MSQTLQRRFSTSELPMLNRIVDARKALEHTLQSLRCRHNPTSFQSGEYLCVTISGERQDDAILELVRPVIEAEIRARIASLDRDIEALGVTVST